MGLYPILSFSSCVNLVNLINFPEAVSLPVQHKVNGNTERANNACEKIY